MDQKIIEKCSTFKILIVTIITLFHDDQNMSNLVVSQNLINIISMKL